MTGRTDDDRRNASVAAVTQGPDTDRRLRFTGDHLDLPILLAAAVEAADTTVEAFIARLRREAIWQDQSLRSADRKIDIQAYLAPEGLRCVIRVAENIWYHHPLETLHVWLMHLPTVERSATVPLTRLVRHDLTDPLPIVVRSLTYLNARKPELGTCLRLDMPRVSVALTNGPSASTDGS
jgi:hypothetical protein